MYRLSQPAPALAPFIESYWHVDATPDAPFALSVDVFVDGRADLIFNFGVGYERTAQGKATRRLQQSNLDAQRLMPIRITQRGAVQIVGVRFRAGGLMPFVPHSLHRFTGAVVQLPEAFGTRVVELERRLRAAAGDAPTQAAALDEWFLDAMDLTPSVEDTQALLQQIAAQHGVGRMEEIGRMLGHSQRTINRLFRRHVGFGPKTWAQIVRFQRALMQLTAVPTKPLSQLATELEYYDQSHLVREYRRFSGTTPGRHAGFFPSDAPTDFAPNLVQFVQDGGRG